VEKVEEQLQGQWLVQHIITSSKSSRAPQREQQ